MNQWPQDWLASTPAERCPRCGVASVRPALWGMPTHEVVEALEAGDIDIHIGGCTPMGASHACSNCGALLIKAEGGQLMVSADSDPSSEPVPVDVKFVIHIEIDGVPSDKALEAANSAWYAVRDVVGEDNFMAWAEARDPDGSNPRETAWDGWDDETDVSYARRE